jgi:hypothetical protein
MVVAEKLGMPLNELYDRMTPEELDLWFLFYQLKRDEEEKAIKKASKRRR